MKKIPQHTIDFIDSWLELRSKWADLPGFSVAISKDGVTLLNKSYGFANLETKEQLTPNHLFHIASHSKTFTATIIMRLQEEGKLRIDDKMVDHLGWLGEHTDKRWNTVTIRQLLSHSAGVIRDGNDSEYWKMRRPFPTKSELQEAFQETRLVLEPNTRLKYSNFGYGLLGLLIEEVTKRTYEQVAREMIIEPLGLRNTYSDYTEENNSLYATGYSRAGMNKQRTAYPHLSADGLAAATGFCSTPADLLVYWQAHLVGSGKLLSDASKREMQRLAWRIEKENNEAYGLGLIRRKFGQRSTIGHGGGYPGFITRSTIDLNDATCVVVLTNAWNGEARSITEAIYGLVDEFGDTEPDKDLLKYEGRFDEVWGTTEFYANANGLRQIWPNSWYPLWQLDQLERVKDKEHIFCYKETSEYDLPGEGVEFEVVDCKAQRAKIGGAWASRTVYGDIEPASSE